MLFLNKVIWVASVKFKEKVHLKKGSICGENLDILLCIVSNMTSCNLQNFSLEPSPNVQFLRREIQVTSVKLKQKNCFKNWVCLSVCLWWKFKDLQDGFL